MNEHLHLNSDGLLRAAYGIENETGWRDCQVCRTAVDGMLSRRRAAHVEDVLPEWFWLRQRQSVMGALEAASVRPARLRWSAIGAMAVVIFAGWLAMQPASAPTVKIASEDERLLTEVSTAVNRVEPQALAPMNMLWKQ